MSPDKIDSWFEALAEDHKVVLTALRELVHSTVPEATEEWKWSRPCYSTDKGLFCYFHVTKKHATLGFHRGTSLDDPAGLLEGTGKDMRHIKFSSLDAVDQSTISALLRQAVQL